MAELKLDTLEEIRAAIRSIKKGARVPYNGGNQDVNLGDHAIYAGNGYFGDFDAGNYSEFEDDGTLEFHGNATVWEDQQVNIGTVVKGASAPTEIDYKGGKVLAFDKAQLNKIYFTAQLSHKYFEGSDIEFHVHLAYPDAGVGGTRWDLTTSWASIDDTFPAETTARNTIASPGVADYHQLASIDSAVGTSAGKKISSVLICSLLRRGTHADDTYDNDIYLVSLDFHIECNTSGSRQISVK